MSSNGGDLGVLCKRAYSLEWRERKLFFFFLGVV